MKDLQILCDQIRTRLDHPAPGDIAAPHEVICLHSEDVAEDGVTVVRLFDLVGGRTGVQSFAVGTEPGPIRFAD